jgi:hypothetical protein
MFDTSVAEHHPEETQPISRPEGDAVARYGAGLLPVEYTSSRPSSPAFNYPYSRSREALDQLSRNGAIDACHGVKMQYVNPATGGYPLPTIAAFIQLLPKGFSVRPIDPLIQRSGVVGGADSRIGSGTFTGTARHVRRPSWQKVSHEVSEEAVLFSASDRRAEGAGLWREENNIPAWFRLPRGYRIGQIVPAQHEMETEIPRCSAREAVGPEFTFRSSACAEEVTGEELAAMDADSDRCAAESRRAPTSSAMRAWSRSRAWARATTAHRKRLRKSRSAKQVGASPSSRARARWSTAFMCWVRDGLR